MVKVELIDVVGIDSTHEVDDVGTAALSPAGAYAQREIAVLGYGDPVADDLDGIGAVGEVILLLTQILYGLLGADAVDPVDACV